MGLSVKPGRRETSTPSGAHPAGARGPNAKRPARLSQTSAASRSKRPNLQEIRFSPRPPTLKGGSKSCKVCWMCARETKTENICRICDEQKKKKYVGGGAKKKKKKKKKKS